MAKTPSVGRLVFNHEWASILFRSDHPEIALADRCKYHMLTPTEYVDGVCMVEVEDIRRLLSPDLKIERKESVLRLSFDCYLNKLPGLKRQIIGGCAYWETVETKTAELKISDVTVIADGQEKLLSVAPYEKAGKVFVPVAEIFELCFGAIINRMESGANSFWKKKETIRTYTCISFNKAAFTFSPRWIETEIDPLVIKDWGNVFETIWFEEGQRLMPYRLYVPSCYRPDKPNKSILMFHGGGTNENVYYDDSNNKLQFYAEKYGYLVIAPTSYSLSTFFGSTMPILQTLDGIDPATADPENPEGWPESTLELRKMANRAAWEELNYIFEHWNVDRNNLFGQGNSAGSNALTYFAITYPGLFRAIIPGAGWVNPNFADIAKLKNTPIMHIIGSEDHHGVDYIYEIYRIVDELELDCKKVIVGGGSHFNAWLGVIDEMFAFYEAHLEK